MICLYLTDDRSKSTVNKSVHWLHLTTTEEGLVNGSMTLTALLLTADCRVTLPASNPHNTILN